MSTVNRRVVITGLGVISPIGIGKAIFWKNAFEGKSGVVTLDFAKQHHFHSTIGAVVQDFNPNDFDLSKTQLSTFDRYLQFALAATKMAIEEATFNLKSLNTASVGVCISNAICGTRGMELEFIRLTENGKNRINPNHAHPSLFKTSTFNSASAMVASEFKLKGPCCTVPTGCAAGLDAIGFSLDLIRSGDVDIMITGASEAPLTPITMAAFDMIGAVSRKYNETPSKASRPYDKDRDGFVLGEGCGILILEEREHAIKRGATILAEVAGYGSTCNAFHMTSLPEEGEDLARALKIALDDADIKTTAIDFISAHGSSTPQNDVDETGAYKNVFGKRAYEIPISALKSMCGHALGASNAVEAVASVGCLVNQRINPTINYTTPDPKCDLNYVPNKGIKKEINYLMQDASGFSGIHSALVLCRSN